MIQVNERQFKELLIKYRDGICTDTEKALLESWLTFGHFERSALSDRQLDARLNRLTKRLGFDAKQTRRLWPRLAAAASLVLMMGMGIYFYIDQHKINKVQTALYADDIAPGRQGATLTLANGQQIKLIDAAEGTLAEESGVTITKSADGQLVYQISGLDAVPGKSNTLSTARGETYRVLLPDSSWVYLNAASSLTYAPSLIENGKRVVKLQGEGYFEIAKDKKHPFIVETDRQLVEVLGTHFNVNAYADDPSVITTLIEGSLRVSALSETAILTPGQQAVLVDNDQIRIQPIDPNTAIDWTQGNFVFKNEDFQSAMRRIARWYDVEIVYQIEKPIELEPRGWVSRSSPLSSVLKMMESTGDVHFKIEGRNVIVTN